MYRILYRFLVPGWSAKPLVSAHDRIKGSHSAQQNPHAGQRGRLTVDSTSTLNSLAVSDATASTRI